MLQQGDTIGDLITKYVGDYTESNLELVHKLNKVSWANFMQGVGLNVRSSRWGIYHVRSNMVCMYMDAGQAASLRMIFVLKYPRHAITSALYGFPS